MQACETARDSLPYCAENIMEQGSVVVDGVCSYCASQAPGDAAQQAPRQQAQGGQQGRADATPVPQHWEPGEDSAQASESGGGSERPGSSCVGDRQSITSRPPEQDPVSHATQTTGTSGQRNPSASQHEQDRELYAAQTQAALQASLHEQQRHEDDDLGPALQLSKQDHQAQEQQLVEAALQLSLEDAERDFDERARLALEQSVTEFQQQFGTYVNEEEEHQARLQSLRTYTEDLSRKHARDKHPRESQQGAKDDCGRAGPSGTSRTDTSDEDRQDSRIQSTVETGSPRIPAQGKLPLVNYAPAQSVRQHSDRAQSRSQYRPAPEALASAPSDVRTSCDWTWPPEPRRSLSPAITIRTACAQGANEEHMRSSLYSRYPGRPRNPMAQPNPTRQTAHGPHATSTVLGSAESETCRNDKEEREREGQ